MALRKERERESTWGRGSASSCSGTRATETRGVSTGDPGVQEIRNQEFGSKERRQSRSRSRNRSRSRRGTGAEAGAAAGARARTRRGRKIE